MMEKKELLCPTNNSPTNPRPPLRIVAHLRVNPIRKLPPNAPPDMHVIQNTVSLNELPFFNTAMLGYFRKSRSVFF